MATPTPSADDFLNDPRFSRTLTLPTDPSHGRPDPFTIKYADYGYHNPADPDQERVLLFFSPLMGSRLLHICKDDLARKHRIRIINPDRPGIGGTDGAPAQDRLALWRHALPALLTHLQIRHLHAVAAHSGGTVYALDFVLHHPQFLLPSPTAESATVLALGAPWILPSHTGSLPLSLAQHLPALAVRQTDKLAALITNHIAPVVGLSAGLVSSLMTPSARRPEDDDEAVRFEEQTVWPALMRKVYEEGVGGLGEDALLFLQKVPPGRGGGGPTAAGWAAWGDYDALVVRLREVLAREGRRLRVRVYYAEKDVVVRDGGAESAGAKWFDACWKVDGNSGQDGDVVEYQSRTVQGADHDHVWDLRWGVVQELFGSVGQVVAENDEA